jgi:hypothetical protein
MPLILRSVKGSNLTPNEADGNFTYLNNLIASVEDNITAGRGIESITISGNVLTFHMSDSTVETVTIPPGLFTWKPRGEWQPSTLYAVNDVVSYFGWLYLVIFAHTSQSTFDPTANDGLGHNYYALILPKESVWGQTISAATYTTVLTDANTYMRFTSPTGCIVTIDPSVDYPAWTEMHFHDECDIGITAGIGGLTIEAPTPGAINPVSGYQFTTATMGGTFTVKQVSDSKVWDIFGLLALETT